jgi:hypothetical protein
VWAVAKGSAVNKAILVPAALAVSALAPWAVTPLLMAGGAFLCFEGFEKLAHELSGNADGRAKGHHEGAREADVAAADVAAGVHQRADLATGGRQRAGVATDEREKIKGAVRTDFVLSAEIIAITLGVVAAAPFATRLAVLAGVAALMTAGVYGLVAAIVKLDDAGLYLRDRESGLLRGLGAGILRAAPWLMKALSVAGTAAMFLVGGGILTHGIAPLHHAIEGVAVRAGGVPGVGPLLGALVTPGLNASIGVAAGALAVGAFALVKRLATGAHHPVRT